MNRTGLRLLIVEDNEVDFTLMLRHVRQSVPVMAAQQVYTREAMETALAEHEWDAIIIDYALPGFEWPQALHLARARAPDLPAIVVSGVVDDDKGLAAIESGADDYLAKDFYPRLAHVIRREIHRRRVLRAHHEATQEVIRKVDDLPS